MRSKTVFRQPLHLPYSDVAPLAGVFFALACLWLLIYSPTQPRQGLVSAQETPYSTGLGCFNLHTVTETTVSLTADGRLSFAVSDTVLQAAVLRQVGEKHGITFTASQLTELGALPYLATTIEQLPNISNHSSAAYQAQILTRQHRDLSLSQLVECAAATKLLAPALTSSSTSFFLSINAKTDVSKVMEVMRPLQNQGINRFNLLVHSN